MAVVVRPAANFRWPVVEHLEQLTQQIRAYDRQREELCAGHHPETALLRQVGGGPGAETGLRAGARGPCPVSPQPLAGGVLGA